MRPAPRRPNLSRIPLEMPPKAPIDPEEVTFSPLELPLLGPSLLKPTRAPSPGFQANYTGRDLRPGERRYPLRTSEEIKALYIPLGMELPK